MLIAVIVLAAPFPLSGGITAQAADFEVYAEKIPHGKTGKNLTVSFTDTDLHRHTHTHTHTGTYMCTQTYAQPQAQT